MSSPTGSPSRYVFTSESVTEGHPDKICDQVSDAVLDALLAQDPASRVACETVVNTGLCLITGEVTTKARVDFNTLVRGVIQRIGYSGARAGGFDSNSCAVLVALDAFDKGLDFADALHLARSYRASGFATFDQRLSKRAKAFALTPKVELLG